MRPFIFIVRSQQDTYYAANGQPGFGSLCRSGDVIHGPALDPPVPLDQSGFTFSALPGPTVLSDAQLASYSTWYWDAEYNGGNFGDCYTDGVALRACLDAYNLRTGRNVKLYAYFHTPCLDFDPGNGDGIGAVARYVNGATVGIAQWQQVDAPTFVANAAPYLALLKANTIDHLGGIRLTVYAKGTALVPLTGAQLGAQFKAALAAGADILESYYGTPMAVTNDYTALLGALKKVRKG